MAKRDGVTYAGLPSIDHTGGILPLYERPPPVSISNNSTDSATSETELALEAVETVRGWIAGSADVTTSRSAARLARGLAVPRGAEFAFGLLDRVVRPENLRVAGRSLEALSRQIPDALPAGQRIAIALAGGFAPLLPWPIVSFTRKILRQRVAHLIVDANHKHLDRRLRELRTPGICLNLALLGEAAHSEMEADRRLAQTRRLLARADVDHISITVRALNSQLNPWAFEATVIRVVERLTPIFEQAAEASKFISLDMHESRDLDLTIEVFRRLLEQPTLQNFEAGIVLQAYLPDSLRAMQGLTTWAIKRRTAGGAGIRVGITRGANRSLETIEANTHGWPLAVFSDTSGTDTNLVDILEWSLTPERTDAVRLSVASENLFDIAYAWRLARHRQVEDRIEFEMLLGPGTSPANRPANSSANSAASSQAYTIARDVGGLRLYTPMVDNDEFDSAIPYLTRRLDEATRRWSENSSEFTQGADRANFEERAERFLRSFAERAAQRQDYADVSAAEPLPIGRTQDRRVLAPVAPVDTAPRAFVTDQITDPSLAANRQWGRELLGRIAASTLGESEIDAARVADQSALESLVQSTIAAGHNWGERRADTRATVLNSAAEALGAFRAELIEVLASETGKTIAEGDVEVSGAIDFAHFYAESARELDRVPDAEFVPSRLTVVVPSWSSPVASAAGSVLAALAAGSGVLLKPPHQSRRTAAVLIAALHAGGIPRDVLALVDLEEGHLAERLMTHAGVDRVLLTGAWETALLLRSGKSDVPLRAESNGKNAIIVTPSADFDRAVSDIVTSAFGSAGQTASAASLVILVGSVGTSVRFRRALIEAVTSLTVGYPQDATTQMGPLIEPPRPRVLRALTTLMPGETWLIQPGVLDDSDAGAVSSAATGRLWSPGLRDGVAPGSDFHLTDYPAPVLGIMRAANLAEAIVLQNEPPYGLAAGLQSLDAAEIAEWIDTVDAGNLFVNRNITTAMASRQPAGGWKRSTLGASAKTGGPNYLLTLGSWQAIFSEPSQSVKIRGISEPVITLIEAAQPGMGFLEFDRVRAGALSDQRAWEEHYGVASDVAQLGFERNVLRYLPVPVMIRLSEKASSAQLVRLLAAATRAGAAVAISSAVPVAAGLVRLFASDSSPLQVTAVIVETDESWHVRVAEKERSFDEPSSALVGIQLFEQRGSAARRIRLIEGDAVALSTVLGAESEITVYSGEVTTSGRLELLPFVREQAISITVHRYGTDDPSTFVAL